MKKTILYTIALVFVVSLGAAYAGNNGITDFVGASYEELAVAPVTAKSVERVSAGGLRAEEKPLYNGITDFIGKSHEELEGAPAPATRSVERDSAGGLRAADPELHNGVTDFRGTIYDGI